MDRAVCSPGFIGSSWLSRSRQREHRIEHFDGAACVRHSGDARGRERR
jgi:hypothetical protein